MNILKKIGIVGLLSGMGTMVYGVSDAAFCKAPNVTNPPFVAIPNSGTATITCSTTAPVATGIGTGNKPVGKNPTICANLQPGRNGRQAQVNGYDAAGNQVTGCVKHDSVPDGTAACAACPGATQFQLVVFNNA